MSNGRVVTKRKFTNARGDKGQRIENTTFSNCMFRDCAVSWRSKLRVDDRCIAQNVAFDSCRVVQCSIGPVILNEITVNGLESKEEAFFVHGAAFRHVLLQGDIGPMNVLPTPPSLIDDDDEWHPAFIEANAEFYKGVDWALDTRGARTEELTITGIPVDLIRYAPETQAIVRRERLGERWNEVEEACQGTWFSQAVSDLKWFPSVNGILLVTPAEGRNPKRKKFLDAIGRLRDLGIADR